MGIKGGPPFFKKKKKKFKGGLFDLDIFWVAVLFCIQWTSNCFKKKLIFFYYRWILFYFMPGLVDCQLLLKYFVLFFFFVIKYECVSSTNSKKMLTMALSSLHGGSKLLWLIVHDIYKEYSSIWGMWDSIDYNIKSLKG